MPIKVENILKLSYIKIMILDLRKDIAKWAFSYCFFQISLPVNTNNNFMRIFIKIIIMTVRKMLSPDLFLQYF